MIGLGALGFVTPWLLWALAALPVLWLLLRAVPPAPIRRHFPAVVLLLGLQDDETVTDKTPWWLILLRILTAAAVIIGLAGPVLNPQDTARSVSNPLLIVLDGSWAGAQSWQKRLAFAERLLDDAESQSQTAAILNLSAVENPVFQTAGAVKNMMPNAAPKAWQPRLDAVKSALSAIETPLQIFWLSDGLTYDDHSQITALLETKGNLTVFEDPAPVIALRPAQFVDGTIQITALRSQGMDAEDITLRALGLDPNGTQRVLSAQPARFRAGETEISVVFDMPNELRSRITRFDIQNHKSAGTVVLSDDSLQRREVGLIGDRDGREGLELLSPFDYLFQALVPTSDLLTGSLGDVLPANPDVVVLADIADLTTAEDQALTDWVENGGLLLRFAGPRLAASDFARSELHPLMPVRLRSGGRSVGGSMSWGAPKTLSDFNDDSPFYGLPIPTEVTVHTQVVAQPDPELANRVIAELADGTPLVTRKPLGNGSVVLFHISANAEWSNLPLSGLFVQMLNRLAITATAGESDAENLEGTVWKPLQVLSGDGRLMEGDTLPGVDGRNLIEADLSADLRPGIYQGPVYQVARNVLGHTDVLVPIDWPDSIDLQGFEAPETLRFGGYFLAIALGLLMIDMLVALALTGRLNLQARVSVWVLVGTMLLPADAIAQTDEELARSASAEVVLGYILTGDPRIDNTSRAGLQGLSDVLYFRTSVEPALPIGLDLERDDLSLFPFLYWPISPSQALPSTEAYEKLNRYLRSGGMILFDTRDADIAGYGGATPESRQLQALAQPLAIPALEHIPADHVLTRTFYLLQDFPGRHAGRSLWVEAAPVDAEQIEGMPFRNLNDGVTPVVIGGNDWAAAWATDDIGNPLFPVGRGFGGERQRELAYRFGVNLVMHVLTGNYKSDQVHVPALLDRLGQ